MNHEEAQEVAEVLTKAIDEFLAGIGSKGTRKRARKVEQLLWDNKIGITHVLRAYGTEQSR